MRNLRSLVSWLANPVHFALTVTSLLPALLCLIYVESYRLAVPFRDEWTLNAHVALQTAEGHLTAWDLLFVNGGHRAFFTNLVTALSTVINHWDLRVEGLVALALAALWVVLLMLIFRKAATGAEAVALVVFACLSFAVYHQYNWWTARHSHWYFENFFFLAALWVCYRRPLSGRALIAACLLGVCATFSMATGVLVWPIMLVVLWAGGERSGRKLLVWTVVGSAAVALYINGSGIFSFVSSEDVLKSAGFALPPPSIENAGAFFHFGLRALGTGLLFAPAHPDAIDLVGWFGLCLFVLLAGFLWRRERTFSRLTPWIALAAFAVGSSFVIAFGRADFGGIDRALVVQYSTAAILFWIALAALMVMTVRSIGWKAGRQSRPVAVTVVLVGLTLLGVYGYSTVNALESDARHWQHGLTLTAGSALWPDEQCVVNFLYSRQTGCLDRVSISVSKTASAIDQLAADNLTLFARLPTESVLPDNYRPGSPIVIASPDIWINVHVRDRLLDTVSEDQLYHAVTDSRHLGDVGQIPNPPVRMTIGASQPLPDDFQATLDKSSQVWIVEMAGASNLTESYRNALRTHGYIWVFNHPFTTPTTFTLTGYERPTTTPQPQFRLGDHLTLNGWMLEQDIDARTCDSISLQTVWATDAALPQNYSMTAVVAGTDGIGKAHADGAPASLDTSRWRVNQFYADRRSITLPCDLPQGGYNLLVGIYDYRTGVSLPATHMDGAPVGNLIYLTTLHVAP